MLSCSVVAVRTNVESSVCFHARLSPIALPCIPCLSPDFLDGNRPAWLPLSPEPITVLYCRYRLRSRCTTCPSTAWLLFLAFSLAIVAGVGAAVYLSKKRINMAGLSIGVVRFVGGYPGRLTMQFFGCAFMPLTPFDGPRLANQDFLQVLSMFANFGFDWPPAIKGIYNVFSLVNFNFELLAPECSVSVNFEAKWCVPESELFCCE